MIYLSYFLGNIVIMRARLRGWPKTKAPFRLGRWGMLVNIVALVYGGAMLVNFAWPRAASNPKPNQTNGLLHLNFLDGVPILWTVVIFIVLIGAIYYLIVGRTKEFAPVVIAVRGRRAAGRKRGRAARMTLTGAMTAPRTGSRRPPRIVREPGTTCPRRSRTGWPGRSPPARWPPATGCRPSMTWPSGSGSAG